jgi:hypothetical protein
VIANPLFQHGKTRGFDAAGANPAGFLGRYQLAFFQRLQVLDHGARVMLRGSANRETDIGPSLSLSTMIRRL